MWESGCVSATAAMMCPRLKSLKVIGSCQAISLLPILKSVGCSLITLEFDVIFDIFEEIRIAALMMPYMISLREFSFTYSLKDPIPRSDWTAEFPGAQMKSLISSLPRTLRSLSLNELDGSLVKHLAMFLACGGLPELSDLTLSAWGISTKDNIADCFGIAMMSPAGRGLKRLEVDFDVDCLVSRILGLSIENPPNDILPNLETLTISDEIEEWNSIAPHLLKGRLPKLIEINRTPSNTNDSPCWYEWDVETTRLWFQVLRKRPDLRVFEENLCFSSFFQGDM